MVIIGCALGLLLCVVWWVCLWLVWCLIWFGCGCLPASVVVGWFCVGYFSCMLCAVDLVFDLGVRLSWVL